LNIRRAGDEILVANTQRGFECTAEQRRKARFCPAMQWIADELV